MLAPTAPSRSATARGGISAFYGASYNTIGGTASGAGNVIANNQTRPGVNIGASDYDDCTGNEILSNSIYNNGMLGINLGFSTSPTQNMPGGNLRRPQRPPELSGAHRGRELFELFGRRSSPARSTALRSRPTPFNSSPARPLIRQVLAKDRP